MLESDSQKWDGAKYVITINSNKIHLPDSEFFKWCQSLYGINKGIYNTIDLWFYESNKRDILSRRRCIVEFLTFISSCKMNRNQHHSLRFGHGGLVKKLEEFFDKQEYEENLRKRNHND
ncbi:hypothetical protein R7236_14190 [Priestia megaterium]|uniref:hypothetical protein n=1 Tax=Priestia megaterium TaxID=1404 RepID=UPI0020D254C0|nr:hypothetical protein [Priestia megaterium]MDW4509549.1 hypothetical protein [Priestia megaterium]